METLLTAILWALSALFGIVMWIFGKLFWIVVWLLLPFLISAFVLLRVAEKMLGREVVRAWLGTHLRRYTARYTSGFGRGLAENARHAAYMMSVAPLRVIGWFFVYTIWHSILSLFWRPKWQPWTRAWNRRLPAGTKSGVTKSGAKPGPKVSTGKT